MESKLPIRIDDLPDVLTPTDLMQVLPIGRNGIYDALKGNEIPNRRIGHKIIVTKVALLSYLGLGANSAGAGHG